MVDLDVEVAVRAAVLCRNTAVVGAGRAVFLVFELVIIHLFVH